MMNESIPAGTRHRPDLRRRDDAREDIDSATPCWLLSIRGDAEWAIAVASGARIIDFKEPRRGALAPVDPRIWDLAAGRNDRPANLSVALGEPPDALEIADRVPTGIRFAKVGPSGCNSQRRLIATWTEVRRRLTAGVELVAVAYADRPGCPDVETVLRSALDQGFRRVLIDTFIKDGRSAIDHLGLRRLETISRWACDNQLWWALAGSIRLSSLSMLSDRGIAPNCFGVRGDVCVGGRTGTLCENRIGQWASRIRQMQP